MKYLDHAEIVFNNGERMRIGVNYIDTVNVKGAKENMLWEYKGGYPTKDDTKVYTVDSFILVFADTFKTAMFVEGSNEGLSCVDRLAKGDVSEVHLYGVKAGEYVFKTDDCNVHFGMDSKPALSFDKA